MNKIQEIEEELRELAEATEHAANKLKELREPNKREPQVGNMWESHGDIYTIDDAGHGVSAGGFRTFRRFDSYESFLSNDDTYLGSFYDVYCKIADVREALSHKDIDGDGMLDYINTKNTIYGGDESFKALRKLNIITD